MTQNVHILNANYDYDLCNGEPLSLESGLRQHAGFLWMQFLPLVYGGPNDLVLVSDLPPESYLESLKERLSVHQEFRLPRLGLLKDFNQSQVFNNLHAWAYSKSLKKWLDGKNLGDLADAKVVRSAAKVHDRDFVWNHCPRLPGAMRIENVDELLTFRSACPGTAILKNSFGWSGIGKYCWDDGVEIDQALKFCNKEWKKKLPIFAEPFVNRELDFSSQWFIADATNIQFRGTVILENSYYGGFKKSIVGPEYEMFRGRRDALGSHLVEAMKVLKKVAERGYRGPIGLDAMCYKDSQGSIKLHPIVEINARETMGWVAVQMRERFAREGTLELSYGNSSDNLGESLLPDYMELKGNRVEGATQMFFRVL